MIAIIPIRGPEVGIDELDNEYIKLLHEIQSFGAYSDFVALIDDENEHKFIKKISFSTIDYSVLSKSNLGHEINLLYKTFPNRLPKNQEFLRLSISLNKNESEEEYADFLIDRLLRKLLLIIHLAYNTKVDFLNGIILNETDNIIGTTKVILNNIELGYQHSQNIKWPKIRSTSFIQTVNWFNSENLHTDGISKSKSQRAVNALSYLFTDLTEQDTSNLFWVMVGIEALLAEENTNIMQQIRIKTSLILGEPIEFKRKLNKLYDYRSRLVHGDLNFPAKFSSDYDIFEVEYWDYLQFATSILLALIKDLIINGKHEFKFEYKLI